MILGNKEYVFLNNKWVLKKPYNAWSGKRLIANGDSITEGNGFKPFVEITAENLQMNFQNYAIGGSTIAVRESNPTNRDPIVTRYQNMRNDADLIIIAGGTNDHAYEWTPIGSMADRTNNTFYGALHNLCLGLLDKYIGKQLLFMTPIKRYSGNHVNARGETLEEYADIIKEVCGFYGVPVLDMFRECTLNPGIQSQLNAFFADPSHPNRQGHEIMARRVVGFLKQLA